MTWFEIMKSKKALRYGNLGTLVTPRLAAKYFGNGWHVRKKGCQLKYKFILSFKCLLNWRNKRGKDISTFIRYSQVLSKFFK